MQFIFAQTICLNIGGGEPGRLWSRADTNDVTCTVSLSTLHIRTYNGHCMRHLCLHMIKAAQALPLRCIMHTKWKGGGETGHSDHSGQTLHTCTYVLLPQLSYWAKGSPVEHPCKYRHLSGCVWPTSCQQNFWLSMCSPTGDIWVWLVGVASGCQHKMHDLKYSCCQSGRKMQEKAIFQCLLTHLSPKAGLDFICANTVKPPNNGHIGGRSCPL